MFDDDIDDYYQNKRKKSISERNIILEQEEEEYYFVTAILMGVETVENFRKMETLVVDLTWTGEMQKADGEMFMIAGKILISKIFINASTLIFQKRELHIGGFGGFTLDLSF